MPTILKKRGRDRLRIMAEVLAITEEAGSGKSRIMYGANLSYSSVKEYLSLLLGLRLLKEVKKGARTIYEPTEYGLKYLRSYREIRALLSQSEGERLESEKKAKSKKALKYRRISESDVRSEIAKLKTRVKRLERIVPKLVFCPTCGKEVRPNFRLCPYCGEKLPMSKKINVGQT